MYKENGVYVDEHAKVKIIGGKNKGLEWYIDWYDAYPYFRINVDQSGNKKDRYNNYWITHFSDIEFIDFSEIKNYKTYMKYIIETILELIIFSIQIYN